MKKPINTKTQLCDWSINHLQQFSLLTLLLLLGFGLSAQNLATWDFEGETTAVTTVATNATATAAVFGPTVGGISFPAGNGSTDSYSGNNWPTGGIAGDRYLQISVEADPGYELNLTGITFDERRSSTGPTALEVLWSAVDAFVPNAVYGGSGGTAIPDDTDWRTRTFMETESESKIIFRIYGTNAEGSTGTFRFDNIAILGTVVCEMEAPDVTCMEFSEDFDRCPSGIGAGSPPGTWFNLPANGMISTAAGGSSVQTFDLSNCISDNTSSFTELEYSTIDSYEENRTECSLTIVNEFAFRDACGNVADNTILVKFNFMDPGISPTITCPAGVTVECGDSTAPAATGMASADDDCSAAPDVTFNDVFTPSCGSGTGMIARTWTATDQCGGSISCLQTITIVDTSPPTVSCAEFTTLFDGECSGSLTPNVPSGGFGPIPANGIINVGIGIGTGASYNLDLNGCVSDDCAEGFEGLGIRLVSSVTGNVNCGQMLTNTYDIQDACGNISPDLVTIVATFSDTEAPEVTCADFTDTFNDCPVGLGPNTPNGNWSPIPSNGIFSSTVGGSYTTTVDVSGCLSDNCSDLDELEKTLNASYFEGPVTECSRTIVNEMAIRDACGNVSEDFIYIKITITNENINTPPVITCPANVTVECGMSTDPADTGGATAIDDCGTAAITFDDTFTPGCGSGTGMISRAWTATDGCGATSTCTQIITVVDTTPPSITCPPNATVECGGSTGPAATGTATGSDACGTVTITSSDSSVPGCGNTETITRTWTATDACGMSSTCTQVITVVDTTPPVIVCPPNMTLECGSPTDLGSIGKATGTDACGSVVITFNDVFTPGCGTGTGLIARTFTATDECGLMSTCTQMITLVDETAPVFDLACQIDATFFTEDGGVCPADATISLSEGDEFTVDDGYTVGGVDIPPLRGCLSDNCEEEDALTIVVDDITVSGSGTCMRTITLTLVAKDPCNNVSDPFVCNYTFIDDTAPVFDLGCQVDLTFFTEDGNVCPADATISLSEGDELTVFDGWTVGGIPIPSLQGCVEDNCTADADLTITVDDITIVDDRTCSRTITVTFIADDGCGNFSDPFVCNYTFIDNTGPEVSFNGIPDGGTYVVECDLPSGTWDPLTDIGELTITDNCSAIDVAGITEVLTQLYDGPCVGNVLTRWQQVFTVMDICGNTTVYTLFTEIIDTTPPVFVDSPDDVTIECDETAETPEMEALDSCSDVVYSFNEVRTDGACPNNYTLTRTWLASDGCGNTSSEVQIVTVEDTTPPEIEFIDEFVNPYEPGQDVFIACSELDNILTVIANNAVATDNCSGNTPVSYELTDLGFFDCAEFGYVAAYISTWKSEDECGNAATATINWFLVDEAAPVLMGVPADACADANDLPPVADVTARDDCEFAQLSFNESDPIDCDGGQYIERTWTATDVCGNTVSATQTIVLSGANGAAINIDYPGVEDASNGDLVQIPVDCDQNIELAVAELEAAISVNGGCGSSESSVTLSLIGDGNCQDDGYIARYQLSIMASDPCSGEDANLELTIDFVDQTPPVISGPEAITLNCGDDIPLPIAEDACGAVSDITFIDNATIAASCSSNPVAYQRTWMVSDDCGNTATFVQSITIIDNEGPVFSNVPDDACNDTSLGNEPVTAFDTCKGEEVAVQFSEMTSNEAGCGEVLTRTWTATDACGNTSTATQQVFFNDDTAPAISFSNDLIVGLENGELFINVGDGFGDPSDPLLFTADDVLVTDNCATISAVVSMQTTISTDCAADGYLARYDYRFVATDPCGNSRIARLRVYYRDGNAPDFFNTPDDLEVFCSSIPAPATDIIISDDYDEDVDVSFSETQVGTAEGVLITRTWTATDDCGNTSSFSQQILVVDNTLSASFSFGSAVIECNTDDNRLGVTAMGGTPPYSYEWQLSDPLEDGYITSELDKPGVLFTIGYITQTFSVLITDANGCQLLASVTVECDFSDDEGDFLISGGNNAPMGINAYPNPADQLLKVTFSEATEQPATVGLYSLFGQELFRKQLQEWPAEGIEIDTQRLPNGTYLLRIEREGQAPISREIVIIH